MNERACSSPVMDDREVRSSQTSNRKCRRGGVTGYRKQTSAPSFIYNRFNYDFALMLLIASYLDYNTASYRVRFVLSTFSICAIEKSSRSDTHTSDFQLQNHHFLRIVRGNDICIPNARHKYISRILFTIKR